MLSAYEKTIYLDGNATITGSALLTLSATKPLVNEYDACSAIYAENNLHVSGAKLSIDGDFYDVKTVVSSSRNVVKNKTPLWEKPNNGV